jgi:hypothetical protein
MKLCIKGVAIAAAVLWGLGMFMVNTINMIQPGYGVEFLQVMSSIYPGFDPGQGTRSIVTGTIYGIVDAGVAGAIFAWVYNLLVK